MEPRLERELEEEPGARARDDEVGVGLLGAREVPLSAELERLELDARVIPELLAGADPELPEVEVGHGLRVLRAGGARPAARALSAHSRAPQARILELRSTRGNR